MIAAMDTTPLEPPCRPLAPPTPAPPSPAASPNAWAPPQPALPKRSATPRWLTDLFTDWQPPRLSAVAWLATAGATLLLAASVIVVAGNWQAIEPEIRFAGLVASLVAVYFAAEAARRRLPSTARALATLAAALTAPVGVAAAATISQPWPVCTLVGGVLALVATVLQSRRWHLPVLDAATVFAFGLAAVGASALTDVPVIVLGALGSVVALAVGATRRSVALAVAVGLSPLVVGMAAVGFGPGTLVRLGMTAPVLAWAAPLSCTVAAAVIAVIAHRRANAPLAAVSMATFATGLSTWVVAGEPSSVLVWSIPSLVLLATEAVAAVRGESIWRQLARRAAPVVAVPVGLVALVLPLAAVADVALGVAADPTEAVPAALAACGLLATAVGSARRDRGEGWVAVALVGAVGAALASGVFAGLPPLIAAAAAFAAWGAVSAVTPWRTWDLTTAVITTWIALVALYDEQGPTWGRLALVATTAVALVVAVSAVRRNDEGARLLVAASAYAFVGGALVEATIDRTTAPMAGSLVFAALVAFGVTLRPDRSVLPLAAVSLVGLSLVADRPAEWPTVALTALVGLAFAGSSRRLFDGRTHVAAAVLVVAAGLALATAGIDAGTAAVAGVLAGVALTGIAVVDERARQAATAGLTATVLAAHASTFASPVFASLAVMAVGGQAALVGGRWKGARGAVPGAAISAIGLASIWWTTGSNEWMIEAIAPYGATGVDVVVGVVAVALLAFGAAVRRRASVSNWLAYGPGLALAGTWLLATQLEPGTDWATFGALGLGVVSLGVGGWRRLGAPLVAGSLMVGGTLVLSAGPRLAAAPTWMWIAGGGVGLLVIAALVERSDKPLPPPSPPKRRLGR
jgi:hypothetical protein